MYIKADDISKSNFVKKATFLFPFQVISLWHIVDDSSVEMVAPEVQVKTNLIFPTL